MSDRDRSASPVREEPRPRKQKTSGFKWKERRSRDEDDDKDRGTLQRGYRAWSPRRDPYRARSPRRDSTRDRSPRRNPDRGTTRDEDADADRAPRREPDSCRPSTNDRARTAEPDTSVASKFGTSTPSTAAKPKKDKKPKPAPTPSGPMIVVNVNDRLGTKAAIPCFASDNIKQFKAIVAAHIGRQPHEIMLKRQGERPFKDQLTLEDYGVSNGVQLDLELDTGD